MYDLIYYNPVTNPLSSPAKKPLEVKERRLSDSSNVTQHSIKSENSVALSIKSEVNILFSINAFQKIQNSCSNYNYNCKQKTDTSIPVPQLKLGPNGEIILDEKSLIIETTTDKEARECIAKSEIFYVDEFNGSTYTSHRVHI